ncbi:MAG TPA: FAD-dependent oxidoreductase, partial [Chroococcales cyanobacterium]
MREVVVVGGGPAGLAAAIAAREAGASATVYDRGDFPGGILNQCIHSGFGRRLWGEEWTGPEFAERLLDQALAAGVKIFSRHEVVAMSPDKKVFVRSEEGRSEISADAVILANGCWERNRGPLLLPGTRPGGIFTAGEAQQWVNLFGYLPGKKILILGSGDIGLIMARRLCYEGAEVLGVAEISSFVSGNTRNQIQCLEENDIPLWLNRSAVEVHGEKRLEAVTLARFEGGERILGSEEKVFCDALLLSVGLVPENELAREIGLSIDPNTGGAICDQGRVTSLSGFYACGNALQVHDLVDNVVLEARIAGKSAAMGRERKEGKRVELSGNIRQVVPQVLSSKEEPFVFYLRVKRPAEGFIRLLLDKKTLF